MLRDLFNRVSPHSFWQGPGYEAFTPEVRERLYNLGYHYDTHDDHLIYFHRGSDYNYNVSVGKNYVECTISDGFMSTEKTLYVEFSPTQKSLDKAWNEIHDFITANYPSWE